MSKQKMTYKKAQEEAIQELEEKIQKEEEKGRGDGLLARAFKSELRSLKEPRDAKQMYMMGMRGSQD